MQRTSVRKLGSLTFTEQPAETVFDDRQGILLISPSKHCAFINPRCSPKGHFFFDRIRSSKWASTSAFQINYTVTINGFTSSH